MKKVKKFLMAWLTCLTIGVSTIGMTGCDEVMNTLKDGLNIFITMNKDGTSGNNTTPDNQVPVKTPSVGLNFVLDQNAEGMIDPETGESIIVSNAQYAVMGMGTCTDTEVVIPSIYNDGIVTGVGFAGAGLETLLRQLASESEEEISEEEIQAAISNVASQLGGGITDVKIQRIWVPNTVKEFCVLGLNDLTEIVLEKGVETFTAAGCAKLTKVYYTGTMEDWRAVDIDYFVPAEYFTATVYFYSESAPTTSGYYWHYVNGEPTAW